MIFVAMMTSAMIAVASMWGYSHRDRTWAWTAAAWLIAIEFVGYTLQGDDWGRPCIGVLLVVWMAAWIVRDVHVETKEKADAVQQP